MEQYSLFQGESRFENLTAADLTQHEKDDVLRLARNILAERYKPGKAFTNSDETKEYLRHQLADNHDEHFAVLFLTQKNHFIAFGILFHGSVGGASVHPRVIIRRALDLNAAAVIVAHNHPSGVAEPSRPDQIITNRLKEALALFDVRFVDHLIVCGGDITSLSERGMI